MGTSNNMVLHITNDVGAPSVQNPHIIPSLIYRFEGTGFTANRSNVEIFIAGGMFQRKRMPEIASIIKVQAQLTGSVTAGTLTFKPSRNGSDLGGSNLHVIISSGDNGSAEAQPSVAQWAAGDSIGVRVTSTAALAPETLEFEFTLWYATFPYLPVA